MTNKICKKELLFNFKDDSVLKLINCALILALLVLIIPIESSAQNREHSESNPGVKEDLPHSVLPRMLEANQPQRSFDQTVQETHPNGSQLMGSENGDHRNLEEYSDQELLKLAQKILEQKIENYKSRREAYDSRAPHDRKYRSKKLNKFGLRYRTVDLEKIKKQKILLRNDPNKKLPKHLKEEISWLIQYEWNTPSFQQEQEQRKRQTSQISDQKNPVEGGAVHSSQNKDITGLLQKADQPPIQGSSSALQGDSVPSAPSHFPRESGKPSQNNQGEQSQDCLHSTSQLCLTPGSSPSLTHKNSKDGHENETPISHLEIPADKALNQENRSLQSDRTQEQPENNAKGQLKVATIEKYTKAFNNFNEKYFPENKTFIFTQDEYHRVRKEFKTLLSKAEAHPSIQKYLLDKGTNPFQELIQKIKKNLSHSKPSSDEQSDQSDSQEPQFKSSDKYQKERDPGIPKACEISPSLHQPLELSQSIDLITHAVKLPQSESKMADHNNTTPTQTSDSEELAILQSNRDAFYQSYLQASKVVKHAGSKNWLTPFNPLNNNNGETIRELTNNHRDYNQVQAADAIFDAFHMQEKIVKLLKSRIHDPNNASLKKEENILRKYSQLTTQTQNLRSSSENGKNILHTYFEGITERIENQQKIVNDINSKIIKLDRKKEKDKTSRPNIQSKTLERQLEKEKAKLEEMKLDSQEIVQKNQGFIDQYRNQEHDAHQSDLAPHSSDNRVMHQNSDQSLNAVDPGDKEAKSLSENEGHPKDSSARKESPRTLGREDSDKQSKISIVNNLSEKKRRNSQEPPRILSQSSSQNSSVSRRDEGGDSSELNHGFTNSRRNSKGSLDQQFGSSPISSNKHQQQDQEQTLPDIVHEKNKTTYTDLSHFSSNHEYTNLGFRNFGNTCFVNSVFKLFSANPEFLNFLNSNHNTSTNANGPEDSIKKSLISLFGRYKSIEKTEINTPQIENKTQYYKNELKSFYKHFNSYLGETYGKVNNEPYFKTEVNGSVPGNQQDAYEFFTEIVENILGFNGGFYRSTRPESADGLRKNKAKTEIFFPINLPISEPNIHSLAEAFDHTMKEETLEPEYAVEPDQGGERLTQLKSKISVLNLNQIPSYFFTTVLRFDNRSQKIHKHIDSKSPIRMRIFQTIEDTKENEGKDKPEWQKDARSIIVEYEPIGFVIHSGEKPFEGHYYSYIYDDHSKSWFKHSDSEVTRINHPAEIEKVWNDINKNGYIVLYKKKEGVPTY